MISAKTVRTLGLFVFIIGLLSIATDASCSSSDGQKLAHPGFDKKNVNPNFYKFLPGRLGDTPVSAKGEYRIRPTGAPSVNDIIWSEGTSGRSAPGCASSGCGARGSSW